MARPSSSPSPQPPPSLRGPAIVFAVAFLAYARTLGYDWTWLDDKPLILDQQAWLADATNVFAAFARPYLSANSLYYRPLVTVSLVLDAQWSGTQPVGYHLTNVLLHALAAALLFRLLRRRLGFGERVAALAATAFALHPALVEAVAWVPGRNDSLLTVLALGSWLALAADVERPRRRTKLVHLGCLAGALFTKETAVALPVVFLAYLYVSFGDDPDHRRRALRARWMWLGWAVIFGGYLAARAAALAGSDPARIAGRAAAIAGMLPAIVAGVGKLVLPVHLAPIAVMRDSAVWPGVVGALLLGAFALRLGRRVRRPVLLLAALATVATLAPSVLTTGTLALENRLYLPAVGLAIFVAEIATVAAPRIQRGPARAAAAGLPLAVLALATFSYQPAFRDRATFFPSAVAAAPHAALAHLDLGLWYQAERHDLAAAETEYRTAIACDTTEPLVHNNLGVLLMNTRRLPEAEAELRAEIATHPATAMAHYNLGLVLRDSGRATEAAAAWEQALRIQPDHLDSMGELLAYAIGTKDEAKAAHYRQLMTKAGVTFLPPSAPLTTP